MLKVMPYKGIMIYIRLVDKDMFEFILSFKGKVYSSYLVIEPDRGKKRLTKDQFNEAAATSFAQAAALVDTLLGETKVDKKTKGIIKAFEGTRKSVEARPN